MHKHEKTAVKDFCLQKFCVKKIIFGKMRLDSFGFHGEEFMH